MPDRPAAVPRAHSQEILTSTLRREPVPLRPRVPGVPLDVESLIMGLLAPNPEERLPSTAEALASRLETMVTAHQWTWTPEFSLVDSEEQDVEPLHASLHPVSPYSAETPTVRRTGHF